MPQKKLSHFTEIVRVLASVEPVGMSNQTNQDEGGDQKARALKVSYMCNSLLETEESIEILGECSIGQLVTGGPHASLKVDYTWTSRIRELRRDVLWFHTTIVYFQIYTL